MLTHGKSSQNKTKLSKQVKSTCLATTLAVPTRLQFFSPKATEQEDFSIKKVECHNLEASFREDATLLILVC